MNTMMKMAIGIAALIAAASMMISSIVNGITSLGTLKVLKEMMPKYNKVMDLCVDELEKANKASMED